jgi:hypothetical protein
MVVRYRTGWASDELRVRTLNAGSRAIDASENGMLSQRCAA